MRAVVLACTIVAGGLVWPAQPSAQVDFSGTWTLDREISGDLTKATFEPAQNPVRQNGSRFGGGRGGFGGRMGGRRSSGGGNDNGRADGALTADERTRLRALADFVKGLSSISIDHSSHSTFTLTDGSGHSRLFPTDGTPTEQAFAATTVDSSTKWDGPHLVTTYRIGASRDLLFTYVLVPATRQMALRIALDESGRQRADVPELRLVYKLKAAATTTPKPE